MSIIYCKYSKVQRIKKKVFFFFFWNIMYFRNFFFLFNYLLLYKYLGSPIHLLLIDSFKINIHPIPNYINFMWSIINFFLVTFIMYDDDQHDYFVLQHKVINAFMFLLIINFIN